MRFFTWYLCYPSSAHVLTLLFEIQGFSERLVTASRPQIGLMFKQVCMKDGIFPLMNHVDRCFAICLSIELSFLTIGNLIFNVDTRCASKDYD